MKIFQRLLSVLLVVALIGLAACAPPPPVVSKTQLEEARSAAVTAEGKVDQLEQQKADLQQQVAEKERELSNLKAYQRELQNQ